AFEGFGVLLGSASGSRGAGISMDHTHRIAVHRRKHRTIVYMKCGHVSSYWSAPAVGTCRACRAVCRASLVLSVVAMFVTLLTHAPVMMIVSTPARLFHYTFASTSPDSPSPPERRTHHATNAHR